MPWVSPRQLPGSLPLGDSVCGKETSEGPVANEAQIYPQVNVLRL